MLTRDEIFDILKREHEIEISVRTFDYYRDKGLISPIQGRRNRKGLYPSNTPDEIASIKSYQNDGMSHLTIKKLMSAIREKKFYESQIAEIMNMLSGTMAKTSDIEDKTIKMSETIITGIAEWIYQLDFDQIPKRFAFACSIHPFNKKRPE